MPEKIIAIKIDVQGTADQKKKLQGLEKSLSILTKQRSRLKKQLKDGVINNDQYARSISKVNLGLKGTRRQLLVTRQAMLGIDGFTTRLGKSFRKFGTSVSGAFVGLFAAQKLFQIMSDGVKTIKDFEQQMATVKAITGATGEEFLKLEKSAKDLGSSTQFTASQVGKLQEEFAKLGFSTQEILDASEATLELATATGSDLAQSAKVAAATINGFGLEAKDTQKIVDIMAKSFTSSALDISKFETAMASVAPVAAAVGFSIEKTTASLGTLTDAGFDASTSGTALRNILLDTQKAGLTTSEAFAKIRNSLDPAATALDLFGKRGAAVAITLANNEEKTKAFATSLENAAGSAKQMAAVVGDTLEGDLKRLSSAFEGLILGSAGTEFFRDLTQGATELISTLSDLTTNTHEESDALEDQRIKTNLLVQRILRLNEGSEERAKLVNELNVLNKDFLKNLDQENLSNEVLAKRLKEVNKQLVSQILIKREDEKLSEKAEDQADAEIDRLEAEADLEKQLLTIRESKFKGISEEVAIGKTQLEQAQELLKVLDEQSIRSRTQTSFGGSVESTNLQADAADKLRGIINSLSVANREVNEQNEEANKLAENREKLLKKLGIEENANLEVKKEKTLVNTNLIDSEKELTKEKKKGLEKLAKDKLKAEEKLIKDSEKLRNEADLLAITKKEDLEIAKLRIAIQAQQDEIESSIANEDLKNTALLDLEANRIAKEKAIRGKFKDEKAADDLKDDEKTKEKKKKELDDNAAFALEVKQQGIQIAGETALLLTDIAQQKADREKDIELSNLDAQLEGGLITQQQFEAKKLEIEKKAFQKKKRLELANVAISLATEIASIQAAAAANPLNAVTFGGAGISQAAVLTGIAIAKSAIQAGAIASQKFADGGFTGGGSGIADETGFKQAGIVHEGEYVVPKHVLGTSEGSSLVGALENMRTNQPMPNLGIGYANGGMVGGGSLDLQGLENRMAKAISNSLSSIQVTNVATETTSQAIKVNNIEQEASFG
tara:strand:- start:10275 stop:13316 length:3042 start_codon:yes stop_codon:yes gene_type:complete